jgi:hypothetical protein
MALTKVDTKLLLDNAQGFAVNSNIVVASYTIPVDSNAVSAGPLTINSGVTVTVPSGQRWVVL